MSVKIPTDPNSKRPVQPDKGFRTNPTRTVRDFDNWARSNISYRKVSNRYDLPSWDDRRAYAVDISLTDTIRQLMTIHSDESWGYFTNGDPVVIRINKFADRETGNIVFYKLKEVNGKFHSLNRTSNPNKERFGVPLEIN